MTESLTGAGTPKDDSAARTKAINAAYATASKRLREAHLDEFREYQIEEARKLGFDYTPKPTAEEKAERDMAALLDANPALEAKLVNAVKKKIAEEKA